MAKLACKTCQDARLCFAGWHFYTELVAYTATQYTPTGMVNYAVIPQETLHTLLSWNHSPYSILRESNA